MGKAPADRVGVWNAITLHFIWRDLYQLSRMTQEGFTGKANPPI